MTKVLCWMLGISAAVDLALGAWASVAWGSFAQTWFTSPQGVLNDEAKLMGLVLGLFLVFFAILQVIAIRWIRSDNESGFHLAIYFGGFLVACSVVVFAVFQRLDFLLVDGIRGAALVVLGYLGLNEPATVKELSLPKSEQKRLEKSDRRFGRTGRDSRSGRDRRPRDRSRGRKDGARRRDSGRKESKPVVAKSEKPAIAQQQSEVEVGVKSETAQTRQPRRSSGGSQRGDRGSPSKRTVNNRSRTPNELIDTPETPKDVVREDDADRSLAVVVRGEFRGVDSPKATGERTESKSRNGRGDRRRRPRRGEPRGTSEPQEDREPKTENLTPGGDDRKVPEPVVEVTQAKVHTENSGPERPSIENGPQKTRVVKKDDPAQAEVVDMFDIFDPASKAAKEPKREFGRRRRPAGPRRR